MEEVLEGLPEWAEGLCAMWWRRDPGEQALLRGIAGGMKLADMSSRQRTDASRLLARGLLVETDDGFVLNGSVWEAYVRGRK